MILEIGSYEDQGRLIAHRIVLCAASPRFYSALQKEKEEGVIRLEDKQSFDGTSVGLFLYDMYKSDNK